MKTKYLFSALMLMLFVNIGIVKAQTCPSGMIAYWKLEEVSSTVLADYISIHDATSSSVLTNVTDGKVGNAKYFDGAKSASVSDHPDFAFNVGSSFSLEFWARVPSAPGTTQVMLGKRDSNSSGAYWFVGLTSSGNVFFELGASDGTYKEVASPSSIASNTWRHIVAVRDEATNGNYLYVDGTLVASTVFNYLGSFLTDGPMTLGCFNNSSGIPSYFYEGSLDEVAVFNRALTSSEVTAHKGLGDSGIGYCDGYAPSFISTPNLKATVNSLYTYTARATGLQTAMRYSLVVKPSGMYIDEITGEVTWMPSSASEDGLVSIVANNNVAPADTQTFRIFIAEAPDCPTGLSVLLKLEESSGPDYADFYGTHNSLATISPTATTGIVGGGQSFSEVTETGIDIPDNADEFDWNYQDNWSVEFWMKTSNVATMVIVGRHRAVGDYEDRAKWWVGVNDSGEATFSLTDNNDTPKNFEISGGPYLFDNQWHHIIAVREGSIQQNRLYVDGVEAVSETTNYANSFKADLPTPVSVGYWKRTGTMDNKYYYTGILDEVAIFNKAINAIDAMNFYAEGEPEGHCTPGNFAPVITSDPVETATQDQPYSYTFEVDDVDVSDPLTLSAVVKPDWLNFSHTPGQKSGLLSGTPTNSAVGTPQVVKLRVSDGTAQVDQDFEIDVANVNDMPEITSVPSETVDEDVLYTYTLTVEDIDPSDVITMNVVTLPSWMTFDWTAGSRTATLQGTASDDDTGANPINISISDGTVEINESYTLNVNPVNDAPVITGQNPISVDEDGTIIIQISNLIIEDPDNSVGELSLTVLEGNNYTLVSSLVQPKADFNGQLTVPVTVSDPELTSSIFNVVVTVNPVNDAPVINSTPDEEWPVDKLYVYVFEATDVDGDMLTYRSITLPSWLTFDAVSGILTGTPTGYTMGEQLVILNASDGVLDTKQEFIINVSFPDGIEDQKAQRFSVYPSPATDILHLEFDLLSEDASVYIYSNMGTLVKSVNIPMNTEKFNIEVSDLNAGSYYCVLRNSDGNRTLKFLITK